MGCGGSKAASSQREPLQDGGAHVHGSTQASTPDNAQVVVVSPGANEAIPAAAVAAGSVSQRPPDTAATIAAADSSSSFSNKVGPSAQLQKQASKSPRASEGTPLLPGVEDVHASAQKQPEAPGASAMLILEDVAEEGSHVPNSHDTTSLQARDVGSTTDGPGTVSSMSPSIVSSSPGLLRSRSFIPQYKSSHHVPIISKTSLLHRDDERAAGVAAAVITTSSGHGASALAVPGRTRAAVPASGASVGSPQGGVPNIIRTRASPASAVMASSSAGPRLKPAQSMPAMKAAPLGSAAGGEQHAGGGRRNMSASTDGAGGAVPTVVSSRLPATGSMRSPSTSRAASTSRNAGISARASPAPAPAPAMGAAPAASSPAAKRVVNARHGS